MRAGQQWEYKRECLVQERTRLQELAMQAFCKITYVDREWSQRTLIDGAGRQNAQKGNIYLQFDPEATLGSPAVGGRSSPTRLRAATSSSCRASTSSSSRL